MSEDWTAIVAGVAIGVVLIPPIAYVMYRLDKRSNDRARAIKAAEREASMAAHRAGGQTIESSAYNPRRRAA